MPAETRTLIPVHLRALLLVVVGAIVGCHRGPPPASLGPAPERLHLSLSPRSFGGAISLQQRVHVEQNGRSDDIDAVLEITPDSLTLVGLGFGQRLFTLQYDGVHLRESRSPLLPRELQGSDVLSDMQHALWPLDAVRGALPPNATVTDTDSKRTLRQDGQDVMTISYTVMPRWAGVITIVNVPLHYRVVITPVPASR